MMILSDTFMYEILGYTVIRKHLVLTKTDHNSGVVLISSGLYFSISLYIQTLYPYCMCPINK